MKFRVVYNFVGVGSVDIEAPTEEDAEDKFLKYADSGHIYELPVKESDEHGDYQVCDIEPVEEEE